MVVPQKPGGRRGNVAGLDQVHIHVVKSQDIHMVDKPLDEAESIRMVELHGAQANCCLIPACRSVSTERTECIVFWACVALKDNTMLVVISNHTQHQIE
jgi:hypothetical protein